IAMIAEIEWEARRGLEDTVRSIAFAGSDAVVADETAWTLGTDDHHRRLLTIADRAVCALLSGDELAAAGEVEAAGPVGAALACLRAVVAAQRDLDAEGGRFEIAAALALAKEPIRNLCAAIAVPSGEREMVFDGARGAGGASE